MKSTFETKLTSEEEITQKERESSESKIEELEKQLSAESHARRLLETQLIQDKRESETRLREAVAQVLFYFPLSCHSLCAPLCRLRNRIKVIKSFGV